MRIVWRTRSSSFGGGAVSRNGTTFTFEGWRGSVFDMRSVPSNRVPADYEAKSPYFTGRTWFVLPLLHANQRRAGAESAKGPAVETQVHAWPRYVLEHRRGDGPPR